MTTVADNLARWDGQRRGVYEVWFATWNDPATRDGYWLRYVLESPRAGHGEPYGQLWFARFATDPARSFGINRKSPIASVSTAREPFAVSIGPARLGHDHARGALSGGGHAVEWQLAWQPGARTLFPLPPVMYRSGGLGETTFQSPSPDVAFTGTLIIDGERLELTGAPGAQTHVWGTKHAHAWAWAHCNAFDDRPGVVLELLSAGSDAAG